MKAIIILILSFLLFSYSVNAEEKNGAVTEPVKDSEIKVLEEQINIQKKALTEVSLKSEQNNDWFIVGAAGLGAALGAYLSYILTNKSTRIILRNNILADSLKFIFKTRDIVDNIIVKKQQLLDLKKTNLPAAEELLSKLMAECDEDLRQGFLAELFFHTAQLKRLKEQEMCEKFEAIVDAQSTLFKSLFRDQSLDGVKDAKRQWLILTGAFTSYYIKISKV